MKRTAPFLAFLLVLAAAVVALNACGGSSKSEADLSRDALNKGLKAQAAGKLDEATADYQEALKHDPRNKYALYDLGVLERLAGRNQPAENYYRLALGVDPDFPEALFNLGRIKKEAGANQEAVDLFRHVIVVTPDDAAAHLNLAQVLLTQGNIIDGNAELLRATQLDPSLIAGGSETVTPSITQQAGATPRSTSTP